MKKKTTTKSKNLKLKEAIALFLDEKEYENLSQKTIEYYRENLRRFTTYLNEDLGMVDPSCKDFTVDLIKNKYSKAIKNKDKWDSHPNPILKKSEKISANTYRTYINAVRIFGNWLYKNDYIKEDISHDIKLPKKQEKTVKLLNTTEIQEVFNQFNLKTELGLRNWIIFYLALDMGLRESSIVKLKISKLKLDESYMFVWLKGDKEKPYAIDATLKVKLRKYLLQYRNDKETKSDNLLLNIDGTDITVNTIKQLFKKLKAKTGIQNLSCHKMRHNFATNYVLMGHSKEDLKSMLGHTTTKMSEHYVHIANDIRLLNAGHDSYLKKIKVV